VPPGCLLGTSWVLPGCFPGDPGITDWGLAHRSYLGGGVVPAMGGCTWEDVPGGCTWEGGRTWGMYLGGCARGGI
jgi:hypothetical protein